MNIKDIRRHLPSLPVTPKGRMKQNRGGIRGTRNERKIEFEKGVEEAKLFEKTRTHPMEALLQKV